MVLLTIFVASCKTDFGERYTLGNLEIYFTPEVSKEYVEGMGRYFKENNLILDKKHAVQLTSDNQSFILRMVLSPDLTAFPADQQTLLRTMEGDMKSAVFDGLNFRIEVSDGNFNPIPAANP